MVTLKLTPVHKWLCTDEQPDLSVRKSGTHSCNIWLLI